MTRRSKDAIKGGMMPETIDGADLKEAVTSSMELAAPVKRICSRPLERSSTFSIRELTLFHENGSETRVILKSCGRLGIATEFQDTRPSFLLDPYLESRAYRFLEGFDLGTARLLGFHVDMAHDRYWMFLEFIAGVPLWEFGDLETWKEAALWLARAHRRFSREAGKSDLPRRDRGYYDRWFERADRFQGSSVSGPDIRAWKSLMASRERIVDNLVSQPFTVVHGEYYPSNILVARRASGRPRICPIDWEMAAEAPALTDLAALTSGNWSGSEVSEIVDVYRSARVDSAQSDFASDFEHCRLMNAIQWLGWSPTWKPPQEHRHNWLKEALLSLQDIGY